MNSDHHNTLNFGDTVQKNGKEYHADILEYDENSGKMTLDLKAAYPVEAGVVSYERSASLENGVITLKDCYKLNEAKTATFSFMTLCEPEEVSEGKFVCCGRTVKYDPHLEYSVEKVSCDTPETDNVPKKWKSESIYRIRLTAPASDNAEFTLTVS
jgi:hypothetical protein